MGKSGTWKPQQQRMWALALVAFLIPLPLPRMAPRTDGRAWRELLAGFQARGVVVLTTHPRCREPDLEGLYVHGRREVVVCPRGEPSTTLRHEGWHLVQNLCLGGRTWLSPQTVEARLSRRDREELVLLVRPERRPWEAEARVMAKVQAGPYLQAVDRACAGRLPLQAQGINTIRRPESAPQRPSGWSGPPSAPSPGAPDAAPAPYRQREPRS
jgi:hypothetical protein